MLRCSNGTDKLLLKIYLKKAVYRQYSVLVDNKDAQDAESDSFTIHTAQKHVYLHSYPEKNHVRET